MKNRILKLICWTLIGISGASALGGIAIIRGEKISSLWFLVATIATQLVAYRFYSAWIAAKVLCLSDKRLTPAKKYEDGKDFVPTNKWIVFGHHFAAIAGPGPLIGPTLAMQFGYLPGTIWIILGSVLGGAVQDFVILFSSIRRDGKSLGQMIKDEVGKVSGYAALIGTFAIIIILIAVLALVVVKALMHSPWGTFTVSMTIPIAMIIGIYLFYIKPSGVIQASIAGILLFLLAVYGGKYIHESAYLSKIFDRDGQFLAVSIIIYGFLASALPVWLLLTPRDYLSSFLKLGTIALLAIAILLFQPDIKMPAISDFAANGHGPIFSGKIFPFLFITIACGAISGFHALVASGTTPKIISNEKDARLIGYGSMLLEGFVAMMAIIAAGILEPGIFFAINSSPAALGIDPVAAINFWQMDLQYGQMENLAEQMGEKTLFSRTGGAPSLAVGMASIFSSAFGNSALSMWYHFAIMFEAIFILTTLDAGTRVARFMLEDLFKLREKKLANKPNIIILTSAVVVSLWGYFLYMGVLDPKGGINMLWPLFGMSNQMLAGIALTFASVIILKSKKPQFSFITIIPLIFLVIIISVAVYEKTFGGDSNVSFFAVAQLYEKKLAYQVRCSMFEADSTKQLIFNNKLSGYLALSFLVILYIVIIDSIISCIKHVRNNFKKI